MYYLNVYILSYPHWFHPQQVVLTCQRLWLLQLDDGEQLQVLWKAQRCQPQL